MHLDAERRRGLAQRRATSSLKAICASGSPSLASKLQLLQPHRVAHAAVEDRHFQDRLRQRLQRVPGADPRSSRCARARRERDRAQTAVARVGSGIDDGDLQPRSPRLLQRRGEGKSGMRRRRRPRYRKWARERGRLRSCAHCRPRGLAAQARPIAAAPIHARRPPFCVLRTYDIISQRTGGP